MINQGYSYKVINKLGNLEEENLFYGKKEEQQELLQTVLAANETEADDEETQQQGLKASGSSQIFRTTGTLSSLSGSDEGFYMEVKKQKEANKAHHHPLFRKYKNLKK